MYRTISCIPVPNWQYEDTSLTLLGGFSDCDAPTRWSSTSLLFGAGSAPVVTVQSAARERVHPEGIKLKHGGGIQGGGLKILGPFDVGLESVWISSNTVSTQGGGIYSGSGQATLSLLNTSIVANNGGGWGGGIACSAGEIFGLGEKVVENNQATRGGGIYYGSACSITLVGDHEIRGNRAARGGGIAGYGDATLISNSEGWVQIVENQATILTGRLSIRSL